MMGNRKTAGKANCFAALLAGRMFIGPPPYRRQAWRRFERSHGVENARQERDNKAEP